MAATVALVVSSAGSSAQAQSCDVNQTELTRAIVDSQTALDQIDTTINRFDVALTAVDRASLDAAAMSSARQTIDDYLTALGNFQGQIQPIGDTCGPAFTNDALTLAGLIDRFRTQRERADALLGAYADAELHFQRAYEVWSALEVDDDAARAQLLERIAAVRLAQAAESGPARRRRLSRPDRPACRGADGGGSQR